MRRLLLATLLLVLGGCAADTAMPSADELPYTKVEPGKEDSSAEAVFLDFSFDGELFTDRSWGAAQQVEDQLLYTVGELNGVRGVSRLDRVELTDVETTPEGDGYVIRYHATMPVAWGRREAVPTEYTFRLPRDVTRAGLDRFTAAYNHDCVDTGAHDVTAGSMWYYYRPDARRCEIAEGDVVETVADVQLSEINTTGRFPEYDMVWADDALRVVAVFGKYEDDATDNWDAGISAYNRFLRELPRNLGGDVTSTPATVPSNPGVSLPEVTFSSTLADGRTVEVVAILVDNVRTAGAEFDARYGELSRDADLITYNGHAGLGANIRALARKGDWQTGQYSIVFMNGCDTYAYVDSALWDAHAEVNPDDPTGTKYADIVMNALPSFFREMPRATLALINGLLAYDEPRTYEQIFADIDDDQVVLVSGEQDNTFTPGGGGGGEAWEGMTEGGELARGDEHRFETPTLMAGTYRFEIAGAGDADLYVRIGSAPTTRAYDCRPYRSSSNETCEVELANDAPIHVMVRGYRASDYTLSGGAL